MLLAACASLRPPSGPPSSAAELDRGFEVSGRFAIRVAKDSGSGRIGWQHTEATDDLTISSPIGQGIARIVRRDGVYTLTTREGLAESDTDAAALTERVLGWRLPIAGMSDWLRGRPYDSASFDAKRGASDRIDELKQEGWTIEYLAYYDSGLPERLRITRGGELDLRLVLESWQAGGAAE